MIEKVFEFIKNTEDEKRNQNKEPTNVLDIEISNHFGHKPSKEIRELVRTERITWGNTINNIYFRINIK